MFPWESYTEPLTIPSLFSIQGLFQDFAQEGTNVRNSYVQLEP